MSYTSEQKKGAISTVVFHAVLLLLFFIFGLTHVVPEPLTGIPISFGNSADGGGELEPQESTAPVESDQKIEEIAETNPVEASTPNEKVITQETIETVHVPTTEEIAEKKKKRRTS